MTPNPDTNKLGAFDDLSEERKLREVCAAGTRHTKGPWTLDKSRMILGPCFTGELKSICDVVRGGNAQEADANARLIAAAPDGYELALKVAEHFKDTDAPLGKMARDFLAKVRS